jgi:copper chaperone NosL
MTKIIALVSVLLSGLALTGCGERKTAEAPPPPHELTNAAIGHYCGMTLTEHAGPKAQIILASRSEPVWFSSARDAFSFTMLPEEPKDIRAIYVSDMAKAPSWDNPGATNWINAKQAIYVLGSRAKGGMGADETVPFSDRSAAEKFAAEHGGRLVSFTEVPRAYVLSAGDEATSSVDNAPTPKHDHGSAPTGNKAGHGH